MDEKKQFLAYIEEEPLDEERRLVYADWLEERGEDEEAERQRQWIGSHKWITDLCRRLTKAEYDKHMEYRNTYPDDYEDDPAEYPEDHITYDELMTIANVAMGDTHPDPALQQWTSPGQMNFWDKDGIMEEFQYYKQEFWSHWEIVTGRKGPESEDDIYFRCAC
jgi:uncharacterized protein (TIGR02996 family)